MKWKNEKNENKMKGFSAIISLLVASPPSLPIWINLFICKWTLFFFFFFFHFMTFNLVHSHFINIRKIAKFSRNCTCETVWTQISFFFFYISFHFISFHFISFLCSVTYIMPIKLSWANCVGMEPERLFMLSALYNRCGQTKASFNRLICNLQNLQFAHTAKLCGNGAWDTIVVGIPFMFLLFVFFFFFSFFLSSFFFSFFFFSFFFSFFSFFFSSVLLQVSQISQVA